MRRLLAAVLLSSAAGFAQPYPAGLFNQMQWRLIGPFRAGRVVAVAGVPGDPNTFYFGSVGGGVWKTASAGMVWNPVFDSQRIASIGAIEVAPSNPNIVYVGSGEADMRSDIGFGDGVYKSTDAGKTWKNVGLRDSRQIGRMLVDPKDPNLVYVAALGHGYGPNAERGVYRSTDGGETWRKVLDKGPEVGAIDLAFDPSNSKVIYATTWNAKRPPWSQYAPIEGPGSGLYKTIDGGDHWTGVAGHGLPEGKWGRAGVTVAAGGRRVYALIDAREGGLFRSDDAGATWTRVSNDSRIYSRGWYFGTVTVDPKNSDIVYVPNVAMYRSTDGGKTFTVLRGAPGGDDYHLLWIDPSDSRHMILGTDQGATVSLDGGNTWSTWYNQATAQFYHVVTDNRFPYFVYGCQQDSGTVAIASRSDHMFIDARDWHSVGGAESGYIAIDPKDQDIFYVGNTNGSITRFDRRSGQGQNITPWPVRGGGPSSDISQMKYRFPWTAPLVFSLLEPDTLYYGSQYLLKTTDGGTTWQEISPDLTGADKAPAVTGPLSPENAKARGYGVIYSIAPSPVERGMIWAGSDTGLIHLTRDGGKTWSNVTPKGLADWSKVTHIEASHFDPATAYAAVDRHRMEDYRPYLYRTRDFGKTWTAVTSGIEEPAFLNAIREDPARRGLLFAATELGVYSSFDDGDHWQSLQLNLPTSSMRDLVVQGDDLVVATHGRGFWVLDNITPLRQIDAKVSAADAWLYKPARAIRLSPEQFSGTPFPVEEPKAQNPPNGAMIDYYFKTAPAGEVTLEILDAKNQVVRRYSSDDRAEAPRRQQAIADVWMPAPTRVTTNAGMNRFVWDLSYAPPGPRALPGTYTVRLTAGGQTYTQPVEVVLDPRARASAADLQKRFDLSLSASRELARAAEARRTLSGEAAQQLGAITAQFNTVISVSEGADRTPPAQAYTLFEQARRALDAALAKK